MSSTQAALPTLLRAQAQSRSPKTCDSSAASLDPIGKRRVNCRVCDCNYSKQPAVEPDATLRSREEKACKALNLTEVTKLPPEALEWDMRECDLWFMTAGLFHPRKALADARRSPSSCTVSEKKGRVSVVTPTSECRHKFHKSLWKCFEAQTWPDKELVVVETYARQHSAFFEQLAKKDPRVVYVKFKRPRRQDWSIGLKRNIGTHLATGEFIATFDDDDLYAPSYVDSMVKDLDGSGYQAATLSSWYIFNQASNTWAYSDPIAWGRALGKDLSTEEVKSMVYGYGFSYVYRRSAALDVQYEDINMCEDINFICSLQAWHGKGCVRLFHDSSGICLHVQHGGNTSNSIVSRTLGRDEAGDLDVMELQPFFDDHLGRWRRGEGTCKDISPSGLLLKAKPPRGSEATPSTEQV